MHPEWDYVVSCDLGQANDYTAIVVLEVAVWCGSGWGDDVFYDGEPGWISPGDLVPDQRRQLRARAQELGRPGKPILDVRHVDRVNHEPYPRIIDRIQGLLAQPALAGAETALVVDYGGVGRPIYDEMRHRGLRPLAVTATSGARVNATGEGWNTPKREIVSAAQLALHQGRLRLSDALPDTPTLVRELKGYRVTLTETAHDAYAGRSGVHDDLVMATAQGVWARDFYFWHYDNAAAEAGRPAPASGGRTR
jgi:hypothetical protein